MSGLEASFSLERTGYFEKTLKKHLKALPKRQIEEAFSLFTELLEELRLSPRRMRGQGLAWLEKMEPEPWPGPTLAGGRRGALNLEGLEFWKAYVNLPYAQGAARKGRVIYIVDTLGAAVRPLMFYTHAEFQGRPDDAFLEAILRESDIPPRQG